MANSGTIFDGCTTIIGQDADTAPSYLPQNYVSSCINRQFRGGINRTRPPWTQVEVVLGDGVDPAVMDEWNYGNFQGAIDYQSINLNTQDGICFAMMGNIYFFTINNNKAYLNKIATGNDMSMMHTWFVQAEDQLYIQNGYQDAINWNGDLTSPAIRLNPVLNQMPIGTVMAYCNGRVFVSDRNNNIYASDIIFGDGFTDTTNTRNFTETQYWASGGSFTPPARMGAITGMRVQPSINLNDRGQGELVVFCQNGAFTLNVSIPRADWQDAQIQKVSMIGRGCVSPWSVCGVNNETFFRADDGWSLYNNAQIDFNQRLSFRKMSREVNRWVDADTKWLRQFESAMFFDNRLIATVSPYTVPPRKQNSLQGLHRPSRAMIVLDLDQPDQTAPDAQLNFRWNGLWGGPQPTQLLTAQIRGQQRAFAFSFDKDGKNRLYELQVAGVDDYVNQTNQKVKSFFVTKRFNMPDSGTPFFVKKRLTGGDMWLSDIPEQITSSVAFRPDSYPCFTPLMDNISFGCDLCNWNVGKDCLSGWSQPRYKRYKFTSPPAGCQTGSDIPVNQGAEFQLQVNLEGKATVDRLRVMVNVESNSETPSGDACTDDNVCTPIECCIESPLDSTFAIVQ